MGVYLSSPVELQDPRIRTGRISLDRGAALIPLEEDVQEDFGLKTVEDLRELAREIHILMRRADTVSLEKVKSPPAGLISLTLDPRHASISFPKLQNVFQVLSHHVRAAANGLYKGAIGIGAENLDRIAKRQMDAHLLDFQTLYSESNREIKAILDAGGHENSSDNICQIITIACGPTWTEFQNRLFGFINNRPPLKALSNSEKGDVIDRLLETGSERMGLVNTGAAALIAAGKEGVQTRIAGFGSTEACESSGINFTYGFAYPDAIIEGLLANLDNPNAVPLYDEHRPNLGREPLMNEIIEAARLLMSTRKDNMIQSVEKIVGSMETGGRGAVIMVNDGTLGAHFAKSGKIKELLTRKILP